MRWKLRQPGSGTVGSCDADKVKTDYCKRVTDNKGGQWLSVMTGGGVAWLMAVSDREMS